MKKILKRLLRNVVLEIVLGEIRIGGWCGLCGKWMAEDLFPIDWPYGVCTACRGGVIEDDGLMPKRNKGSCKPKHLARKAGEPSADCL